MQHREFHLVFPVICLAVLSVIFLTWPGMLDTSEGKNMALGAWLFLAMHRGIALRSSGVWMERVRDSLVLGTVCVAALFLFSLNLTSAEAHFAATNAVLLASLVMRARFETPSPPNGPADGS